MEAPKSGEMALVNSACCEAMRMGVQIQAPTLQAGHHIHANNPSSEGVETGALL